MVAATGKLLQHFRWKAVLHQHRAAVRRAGLARWSWRADMFHARRFAGHLHVHPVVDDVYERLHLALGLHIPAHDAEAEPGLTTLSHEAWDDGVERAAMGL